MPVEVLRDPTEVYLPDPSLVVLVGASGSGKSTLAARCFKHSEVVSSDACRGLVSDDAGNIDCSPAAFEVLYLIVRKRLGLARMTAVDATSVEPWARKDLIQLARDKALDAVAIVLAFDEETCQEQNNNRPNRQVPSEVVTEQCEQLRRGLPSINTEGFRSVIQFSSPTAVNRAMVHRRPLRSRRHYGNNGPFDIVGDVHGCHGELLDLMTKLGWVIPPFGQGVIHHPQGRMLVFVGDLVDRGPDVPGVLRLVMRAVREGAALAVPGNHDWKLARTLSGFNVATESGLATSVAQLLQEPETFHNEVRRFIEVLPSHLVLAHGALVVAHAGLNEKYHGRTCSAVYGLCLHGETSSGLDESSPSHRIDWSQKYRGAADVVYGHTPHMKPEWRNRTFNVDTGCVFGGTLSALRWPERELISVPARRLYAVPARPLADLPLVPPSSVPT